jgi:hypothetical protein
MTENPYAIPLEDFVRSARVPVDAQVEVQDQYVPAPDWSSGVNPYGDGMSGEADCD